MNFSPTWVHSLCAHIALISNQRGCRFISIHGTGLSSGFQSPVHFFWELLFGRICSERCTQVPHLPRFACTVRRAAGWQVTLNREDSFGTKAGSETHWYSLAFHLAKASTAHSECHCSTHMSMIQSPTSPMKHASPLWSMYFNLP